jgi:hypothetical protein
LVDPGLEPSEQVLKPAYTVGGALAVVHLRRTNLRPATSGVCTQIGHSRRPVGAEAGQAAVRTPGADGARPTAPRNRTGGLGGVCVLSKLCQFFRSQMEVRQLVRRQRRAGQHAGS